MIHLGAVPHFGLLLVAAASIAFYIASRVAVDALTDLANPSPGRLALGHWMPVALTAVAAIAVGEPHAAVSIALGTSVAALVLNLGLLTATGQHEVSPSRGSRAWPMLITLGLLCMLIGLRAQVTRLSALLLLAQGLLALWLWHGSADQPAPAPRRLGAASWVRLAMAVVVASLGALVAMVGVVRMSFEVPKTTPGMLAAVGVSPLLLLPMIGIGAAMSERGKASEAGGALVGVALLNLGALLPGLALLWELRRWMVSWAEEPDVLPFAMATWRLDVVLVMVVGALLLPVALGRWKFGRTEGVALVVVYAIYIAAASALGARW